MNVYSPDFENNDFIPKRYSCDGEGMSPHLEFEDVPKDAESLALIVDDPDALGGFTHWVLWNISADTVEILPGTLPDGAVEGINGNGDMGYTAPCPPSGTHHYHFKLFALDIRLNLAPDSGEEELIAAMADQIIAKAELVGLYKRG